MKIPLCVPYMGKEELDAVKEVLDSGWLAHGPKCDEFEEIFSKYIGVKKAVSLNSCTSALFLAIKAHKITGEVILPSFTFVASANAIITAGAKPVFADIDYDTCNIDPEQIKKLITPKTQAIMPVHFGGQACDMGAIMDIAEDKKLAVIEDSAETIGGTYKGKMAGSFATGCFSFYPTKNIATGEGGMLTTNDEKIALEVSTLKAHGIDKSAFEREKSSKPWYRAATQAGYNFRMPDIIAAIGIVQAKKVEKMNELRRKHASYLNTHIKSENIDLPVEAKECEHVYQMYTIKIKGDRDKFVHKLREAGVGASVHFDPPVHEQPYYKSYKGDLKVTERVSKSIVTIPMYPTLTKEELDYIVDQVEIAAN